MKSHSIKISISCFVFFVSVMAFAQKDFQGKAYYESKTTVDMSSFGGGDMSDERRKEIASRMKSMFEKTYILTFNQLESIYKEEEKLDAPGGGDSRFAGMMSSFSAGPQYKNIKNKELLQDQEFFGKQFLIKDSLPQLDWKMEGETKQIGQYMCFKATTTKTVNTDNIPNFRRPSRGEETETEKPTTKDIEVVAWYTMQIPVNLGPDEYWGLPGLILEINADRTTILCSKIILNPEEKDVIKVPSKGKEVTKEEYTAIVKKKTEEMRQNFRGSGGPGGGGGGRR
ncbi:GLPGLI family protein [Mariniflexile fucanivorans]|uniref:GLPGLI family protein n=1 Tax=Mariniflexile fucanivorans TaxID=264023 RepID=A0A4V2QDT3_9FLAO|nr:GLPGLI family protein [Mariniflexile fucanivorans]TCL65517.1 GLPGLI family protein [Mariniflexile fucanivorans]